MLSIGRLGVAGGAEYYLDKVANNVDDYYLGHGEALGRWIGATAERLNLEGEVDANTLRNLLAGRSAIGASLGLQLRPDRRPGYDLTFSAPKGVSLLWAFGSPEVAERISGAHDRAVVAVLDQLSAEACYARRGPGGQQLVEARGFIGAAFRHRTSRAGDPQLHTHVVVPNVVEDTDHQWSAPDGRHLYAWKMTAGSLYQSALRAELAPLGLAWNVKRNGLSELRDIPKSVLRAFSKRRVDIEAAMDRGGFTSSKAAEKATLATRQRKPEDSLAADVLRESWSTQLGVLGLPDGDGGLRAAEAADVTRVVGNHQAEPPTPSHIESVMMILAGEKGVSLGEWEIDEHLAPDTRAMPVTLLRSTFSRRDALRAVARAFDVTPKEVVHLTNELLERDTVVRVLADVGAGPEGTLTKSGHVIPATSGDRHYTTTELLAAEERIIDSAKKGIGLGYGRVRTEFVNVVLADHPHLDGEQADGVRKLLTSGNRFDLVIGQAGTGKSTMLRAARIGWESAGFKVFGAAVAARTAADLEAGTGIPSSSLIQVLADLRQSGGLTSKHVVVIDEASMIGSRSLDQLRSHIVGAGAKLVLVGDNRQLSSIDAGGTLRSLARELGPHVVSLTTNRRQAGADQQWEREALVALREGDVVPAVQAYVDHGRVTITGTAAEAHQRLVDDWWAVHRDHADHTTAILAVRRVDVATLNEMVRARRQVAGELGTEVTLANGKSFSVGDRVIFEKNRRVREAVLDDQAAKPGKVQLRNGTFATVVGIVDSTDNPRTREGDVLIGQGDVRRVEGDVAREDRVTVQYGTGAQLTVELDDGRRAVLPPSYAEHSTSLGYALTVFRSQGITVDHTFGLGGDSLTQEAGYTQLSRGRLSNNLYVTSPESPRWEIGHIGADAEQRDAIESLIDKLEFRGEQTMARDRVPVWSTASRDDLVSLYRDHATLGQELTDHAPKDALDDLGDARMHLNQAKERGQGVEAAEREYKYELFRYQHHLEWAREHRDEIAIWSAQEQDIRRLEYRLGQAAGYSRPEHVINLLGPLPERITEVERWQTAAGAIEAYRTCWNIINPEAVGPDPSDPKQRSHWRTTVATLGTTGFLDRDTTNEPGKEWTELSSHWNEVQAEEWERDAARHPEPEPAKQTQWSRGRDRDSGYDRGYDGGFGM